MTDGDADSQEESCKFCNAQNSNEDKSNWIKCEKCREWYHYVCVGKSVEEVSNISIYVCSECEPEFGPSILRRVSSRKKAPIDYIALDHGDIVGFQKLHPYCAYFKSGVSLFNTERIMESNGGEVLNQWRNLKSGDIPEPVIIRKEKYGTLDMSVPEDLTVSKVAKVLGYDTPVEVMDVATQGNSPGWTLGKWQDYYYLPFNERDRVRNVISLEFSYTSLGDEIKRPEIVREFDLVDKVWPSELKEKQEYPKVSLYCLMSVAESYTDFHIDFGGSSVFYHVCQGAKTFLFIPPSPQNLQKYEKWCLSSDQNRTFFGNLVKECYRVDLDKGDSLLIPSGWIHAVYTPADSLVIGGNFLCKDSLPMELKLAEIEKRTRVPRKFLFPYFNRVLWYTVLYYSRQFEGQFNSTISERESWGLQSLGVYLWKLLNESNNDTKESKALLQSIPPEHKKDYLSIIQTFMKDISELFNYEVPSCAVKRDLSVSQSPRDRSDSPKKRIKSEEN